MGHKVVNQVPIVIGTAQEIEGYRARAQSVIDRIKTRDLDYRVDRQNSNSLVGTVLDAFGIRPQELLNSPKHSFNNPVPGFTTDLLNDDDEKGGVREGNGIESSAFREAQGFNVDRQSAPVPKAKPRNASVRDGSLSNRQFIPGAGSKLSPTESQERLKPKSDLSPAPLPQRKPKRNRATFRTIKPALANPFDLNRPQLKQQADMLERNPLRARQMILATGRDPKMFGLS